MILDQLSNRDLYRTVNARLSAGLDFVATFDPTTEAGRYELDGELLFVMVQHYDTGPSTEKRFESHRRYVDIQSVISGRERILHTPADGLHIESPYNGEKDVMFYVEPQVSSSFLVLPGQFAVFFPHDAHKPGCMAGGRDPVVKIVVKVAL